MTKEDKRNYRLAALYLTMTLIIVGLILKFGPGLAIKISEILQNRKPLVQDQAEVVLPAPQLFPLTEATNSATLPLSGYSLANQEIDLYINDLNVKTMSINSEGKFEGDISLSLGLNKIYAITKDTQGHQSSPSQIWSVFYEKSPPYLEILEPANNSLLKKQPDLEIVGKMANTSKVFVNDHLVISDGGGNFRYPVKLNSGENKFKITCLDPAQNKTEIEWILNFQP